MAKKGYFDRLYHEHKVLFTAILVGVFLIELEIFVIAAMRSGWEHTLEISDIDGQVVYTAIGRDIDSFNREGFEKTFGPIDGYEVKRVSREVPFPFRAWFVAAVGFPVGGMLLFAFIVRAFTAVFQGDIRGRLPDDENEEPEGTGRENRLDAVLDRVGRLNIFAIGFFIFLMAIAYWILPNLAVYVGRVSVETVIRYRWVFLGALVVVLAIFLWIVFLRFLLAKKQIESTTELEKYRLELEYNRDGKRPLQLPPAGRAGTKPLIPRTLPPEDEKE